MTAADARKIIYPARTNLRHKKVRRQKIVRPLAHFLNDLQLTLKSIYQRRPLELGVRYYVIAKLHYVRHLSNCRTREIWVCVSDTAIAVVPIGARAPRANASR